MMQQRGAVTVDLGRSHGLGGILGREHDRLRSLYDDLCSAIGDHEREESAYLWSGLEAGLEALFVFEERHLIPELDRVDLLEGAALRREHDEVRALLGEIGDGIISGRCRSTLVADLGARVEHHRDRKAAGLYSFVADRWADPDNIGLRRSMNHALCRLLDGGT